MVSYDLVVVGAGPTGATVAEIAARTKGWRVLVIERRSHVAGNCYDELYPGTELLWHRYGPHYLRFTSTETMSYVGRFTEWIPGNYVVKSNVDGVLVPMPINLETIELLYGRAPLTEELARELIQSDVVPVEHPANSEEFILGRAGRKLYEKLYAKYTAKQWGRSAAELDPSVCGRVPIRFDRNPYYTDSPMQVMPRDGYTALFDRMLRSSPLIDVVTDVDWLQERVHGTAATVFTGPLDEYFGHRLGPLPWRSLSFETSVENRPWFQPCVQVNYPGDEPFTRKVEVKHVTRQVSTRTVVVTEFPADCGEPYYPVPAQESRKLFADYARLADAERKSRQVFFGGRLGTYRYINTDEAIENAMKLAADLA
ncbi:UDP-galactopyranose mutase [Streptomyces sp. NL15-2K]|nr:UDP-galactopyranose mutase [Streptomyces sp. NL15-2K]